MDAIDARRQRDVELTNLRKEVERRKIDTDKTDKKAFKASLLSDQQDMKLLAEQQQKRERQVRAIVGLLANSHGPASKLVVGVVNTVVP